MLNMRGMSVDKDGVKVLRNTSSKKNQIPQYILDQYKCYKETKIVLPNFKHLAKINRQQTQRHESPGLNMLRMSIESSRDDLFQHLEMIKYEEIKKSAGK